MVALVDALARVIDRRTPHSQSVAALHASRQVGQRMRVYHTESLIVELIARDVGAPDQHAEQIGGFQFAGRGRGLELVGVVQGHSRCLVTWESVLSEVGVR